MLELILVTPEKNEESSEQSETFETSCDPTCGICLPCSPMS